MIFERLTVGPLEENCYLIGSEREVAIVDPGAESERIVATIEAARWRPVEILLTHGHLDHIAHCAHLAERYGVGVRVHAADLPYLERSQLPELERLLGARPCPAPSAFLEDASEISVAGLTLGVIHTPGHTPGGVCLLESTTRSILVGDTIFHRSVGRTDLPGGDSATLVRSIRERLFTLDGEWTLWPGHGPETSLAAERLDNPFVGARARFSPW